ncbi:MAG: hypothetical protein EBR09_13920 [Proteobacteria bacterium]|nr:hypothetical protein [Pseudomonadota bacterium]
MPESAAKIKRLRTLSLPAQVWWCALLTACGAASSGTQSARTCPKSPAVSTGGKTNAGTSLTSGEYEDSALNLDGLDGDAAVGTGFIDISTRSNSGIPESRRCTMHVRPVDTSNALVRIWTAGHCFFDPQTDKFQNSKYTVQIYFNGGYFSAEATLEGIAELAAFSKHALATINMAGFSQVYSMVKGQVFNALPSSTGTDCLEDEKRFIPKLTTQKSIACFARGEMRGFRATLKLDEQKTGYLKDVLNALRSREQKVMDKLDANTKHQIEIYLAAHHAELRRVADMRGLAYWLSKKVCDTYQQNPNSPDLYDNVRKEKDPDAMCRSIGGVMTLRDLVIQKLSDTSILPAADNQMMQEIYNDTTTPLLTLRNKSLGCNYSSLTENITYDSLTMTPCDLGNVSRELWRKWLDSGIESIKTGPNFNAGVFGLYPESYLTLATNAARTIQQKTSGVRGKARLIPLNTKTVLNFGHWLSGKSELNTLLTNIDTTAQSLYLTKGDSGSMVSIFGVVPAALLSTVDGQKTAGGATLTPLPPVGSEEVEVTAPIAGNSGC